jgi:hypothetical protein
VSDSGRVSGEFEKAPTVFGARGDRRRVPTIEEVRDYHARTLRLVVVRLNEAQAQHDAKAQIDVSREAAERSSHEENVRTVADEIRFE